MDVEAVAEDRHAIAQQRDQLLAVRVVEIHHGDRLLAVGLGGEVLEPRELGRGIRVDRAVVVEVVLGEIGEDRGVEGDALDSLLVDPVGRDFHRGAAAAVIDHAGEQAVEFDRSRRGVGRGDRRFAVINEDGP